MNKKRCGISFCEALTLILIVLKLVGVLSISWTLALAPVWIPLLVVIGLVILLRVIGGKEAMRKLSERLG